MDYYWSHLDIDSLRTYRLKLYTSPVVYPLESQNEHCTVRVPKRKENAVIIISVRHNHSLPACISTA